MRAIGDTVFASTMMTLTVVINGALEPFLIFGWGPFPQMGLIGAPAAQVFGFYCTLMVLLYFLIFRKKVLSPEIFHADTLRSWKKILHVGLPSALSNTIVPLSAAVITWIVSAHGKEAVASFGVATRIEGMAILNFISLLFYCFIYCDRSFL